MLQTYAHLVKLANESSDNDNDGIGDNADTDDDNDSYSDVSVMEANSIGFHLLPQISIPMAASTILSEDDDDDNDGVFELVNSAGFLTALDHQSPIMIMTVAEMLPKTLMMMETECLMQSIYAFGRRLDNKLELRGAVNIN